eukprot:4591644-Prymnesium_polylepis.1
MGEHLASSLSVAAYWTPVESVLRRLSSALHVSMFSSSGDDGVVSFSIGAGVTGSVGFVLAIMSPPPLRERMRAR